MEKKHLVIKSVCVWLPFAALATILCALAYMLVQQDIRISANYPQSQMAEDSTTLSTPVNIATDLAPFVDVFDSDGKLVESNATLNGASLLPPPGVFEYTRTHGEDSFTWEPETGVRIATVIVYHPGDAGREFVLAGRSLRDVEILESRLAVDAFVAWVIALLATFFFSCIAVRVLKTDSKADKVEINGAGKTQKVAFTEKSDGSKSAPILTKPALTQNQNILNSPNIPLVQKNINMLSSGSGSGSNPNSISPTITTTIKIKHD